MTDDLKLIYWVLTGGIAIVFLIGIFSDVMSGGGRGTTRLIGLILLGIEALLWIWVSKKGKGMIRWL